MAAMSKLMVVMASTRSDERYPGSAYDACNEVRQRTMAQDHAFRTARRTRGVNHVSGIVGAAVDGLVRLKSLFRMRRNRGSVYVDEHTALARLRECVEPMRRGDQERKLRIVDHERQTLGRIGRIERHVTRARFQDRELGNDHRRAAFDGKADQHAAANASRTQMTREAIGTASSSR